VRSSACTWVLFVGAEHHRPLRRVEVQADDIDELGLEVRIVGQLEAVHLPRFEVARPPDASHGVLPHAVPLRHRPGRPVRRVVIGPSVQRVVHDGLDDLDRDLRLPAPPRSDHPDSLDTHLQETGPPTPDGISIDPAAASDLIVGHPLRRPQQRLRLHHLPMRQRRRTRHPLQRNPITARQNQRSSTTHRHTRTLTHHAISATDH
jgi:hypothetical protein